MPKQFHNTLVYNIKRMRKCRFKVPAIARQYNLTEQEVKQVLAPPSRKKKPKPRPTKPAPIWHEVNWPIVAERVAQHPQIARALKDELLAGIQRLQEQIAPPPQMGEFEGLSRHESKAAWKMLREGSDVETVCKVFGIKEGDRKRIERVIQSRA